MATNKKFAPNIDNSDPANFPDGRIRDNSGSGDGTPVNRLIYSDLHEFFAKIMRMAGIAYNGEPENETNGYQLVQAAIALASKNDFLYSLSSIDGIINIPTKIDILLDNETLICKSAFNYAAETQIKGTGAALKTLSVPSSFKTNDYILLVSNVGGSITLVRLADAVNMNTLVSELNYLKAATEAEEYAGAIQTKATTPYTNGLAFSRRVIGLDSANFLATTIRNGLLSKEDKAIIDGFTSNVKNIGWFSGIDPGGGTIGASAPRSGNIVSAVIDSKEAMSTTYIVTVANSMSGNNYFVRTSLESEGTLINDNNQLCPIFKKISNTQFYWSLEANSGGIESIKAHIEVIQLT